MLFKSKILFFLSSLAVLGGISGGVYYKILKDKKSVDSDTTEQTVKPILNSPAPEVRLQTAGGSEQGGGGVAVAAGGVAEAPNIPANSIPSA